MAGDPIEKPSWMTTEFLQVALRSREGYSDVIVENSSVELAVGKGENYSSLLYRVLVEFGREDKKTKDDDCGLERTSLIIKGLSSVEVIVKFLIEMEVFGKETAMYQVTIPAMLHLFRAKTSGRAVKELTSFCYKTSLPHTLVLEDLTTLGFRMADRKARLDLPHCKLALKGLARFHAMSVALHDKDPKSMDRYAEGMYIEKHRPMMTSFMTATIEALANIVGKWEGFEKYTAKLKSMLPIMWDRQVEAVKPKEDSLSVLNHGDCWVNNMMFHYVSGGEPDEVRFVDFQLSRFSSPALDLQYFMYTSPCEDVRSQYMEHLLEIYHEELRETLGVLGCERPDFTVDKLKAEFDEKAFFGFVTACTVLGAVVADPGETFELENIKDDGSEVDVKSLEKTYSGSRYEQVFRRLLPHFEERGIFT